MIGIPIKIGHDLYHLRYPFGVVADLEYIIPDGFYSVFDLDADITACHTLLYAGLKHHGISYMQAGEMMINEGAVYDPITLLGFWKKITDALTFDKWISVEVGTEKSEEPPKTLTESIEEMEREAIGKLDISLTEFYGLTPREFNIMLEQKGMADNTRAGLICATVANALVPKKGHGIWKASDFVRTGEKPVVQTAEQQKAILSAI